MKVYLDTIGCRLNQSEIETFARQFRAVGHSLVGSPDQADLVVVNTCAVTAQAASDSRQKIRQADRSGARNIVVTGCWSTLEPGSASLLPSVTQVVLNSEKDGLVAKILQLPEHTFDLEPIEREPLPGARLRTRAFIKAQDGCDNRCTFCITTIARGPRRSRTINEILMDIQASLRGGAKEIVLTGVHLGSWGQDFSPGRHLRDLVQTILDETGVPRLRLSSLEPWDLDICFFELWRDTRLCRHLHLPLQSGCAATLRRMARKTTPESFERLIKDARSSIPGVAITTDVIVGFPGESEKEFNQSLDFIRKMDFAGGHVFTYSARQGTAAARMPGQVPFAERKARNTLMRSVLAEAANRHRMQFLGQEFMVLWESTTGLDSNSWQLNGLTDNYLRVFAQAPRHIWNQFSRVRLTQLTDEGLIGNICL